MGIPLRGRMATKCADKTCATAGSCIDTDCNPNDTNCIVSDDKSGCVCKTGYTYSDAGCV